MTKKDLVDNFTYQRVYFLRTEESFFTGFVLEYKVEHEKKQYLCTAKHCVTSNYHTNTLLQSDYLQIYRNERWERLGVKLVGFGSDGADICVFTPADNEKLPSPNECPEPSSVGISLSQDTYFLGFPYGMRFDTVPEINNGYPLPFFKKAIMSAGSPPKSKPDLLFLDGHANPGFSGGPVVFKNLNHPQKQVFQTGAIISAYKPEPNKPYGLNTGIAIAHDIKHAIDAIEANPTLGLKV